MSDPEVFELQHTHDEAGTVLLVDRAARTVQLLQRNQGGHDHTRIDLCELFMGMLSNLKLRPLLTGLIAQAEMNLQAEQEAGQ